MSRRCVTPCAENISLTRADVTSFLAEKGQNGSTYIMSI